MGNEQRQCWTRRGEQSGSKEMKTRQVWQLGQRYRRQCVFHDTAICREACQHCPLPSSTANLSCNLLTLLCFCHDKPMDPRHHVLLYILRSASATTYLRGIFHLDSILVPPPHFRLHALLPLRRCHTQLLLKRLMLTPFDYANTLVASRAFQFISYKRHHSQ